MKGIRSLLHLTTLCVPLPQLGQTLYSFPFFSFSSYFENVKKASVMHNLSLVK